MWIFKTRKFASNEQVIHKIKVNFVRERFSACQNQRLTRFLFINDCDEKAPFYLHERYFLVSYENIKMEERKKAQFF